jgi:hypothetical protein
MMPAIAACAAPAAGTALGMRAVLALYALIITAGLSLYIVVGLTHG